MAVYGCRLRVTGNVDWYGYRLLPFITVFRLIPSIFVHLCLIDLEIQILQLDVKIPF
jgi:hypothetical protein